MNQEFVTRRGLISQGGITFPYVGVTTTYSISSDDYFIEGTSGTFNVTLPTAVGSAGKIYVVKNSGSGVITVDTTSSETIDGVLTKTLNQYDSVILESNGANWVIVGDSGSIFSLSVDNGLSLIGATAILGGTLSQWTNIELMSNVFTIEQGGGLNQFYFDSGQISISKSDGFGTVSNINFVDGLTNWSYLVSGSESSIYLGSGLSSTDGSTPTMMVRDTLSKKGLVYATDYTGNFTTHSLITKGYVDSLINNAVGATNGLSEVSSGVIALGGTISQNTILHGEGYDLIMSNFDNLYFTSSVFDVESDFISLDSGDGSIQIISGQDIVVSANDALTISATSGNITTFNLEGLVYTADYNATFVTHSLVDKQYVDSLINAVGATNGLSEVSSGVIALGGTISQNTLLQGEGYDLTIENFNSLYFTSSIFDVEADLISLDAGTGNVQIFGDSGVDIVSASSSITISGESGLVTISNLEGLVYTADYNPTFVTHSLIDKQYVDSLFALTGGSFYTEVTHAVLLGLIASNSLGTASNYLITDYQTVYLAPDYYVDGSTRASAASFGPVEPILVTALSCNSLEVDAYQPAWPLDTIKYDVTQQSIGSDGVSFGTIIERVDEYGNRTDYDHRNVLYKRYQSYNRATISSHADKRLAGVIVDYDCTTGVINGNGTAFLTQLSVGDIILIEINNFTQVGVKVTTIYSDILIDVLIDSTYSGTVFSGESFEYYASVLLIGSGNPGDYSQYCDWKEVYVGQSDAGDWASRYTFDFAYEIIDSGQVLSKNNFINNHEGVLYGSGFVLSNIVFGRKSISNTIGNYSFNNTFPIGSSFNTIGDLFTNNTIYGNSGADVTHDFKFNDNRIDNNFEGNTIFGVFRGNQIGNGFVNNYINSLKQSFPQDTNRGFSFNTIGVSDIISTISTPKCFNENKIIGTFRDNTIDTSFWRNKIYNFFSDNQIGSEFEENEIGTIDFLGGGGSGISSFLFSSNIIRDGFMGNIFYNSNFNNNNIGDSFGGNIIRGEFYGNQIGKYFTDNKTNDNFGSNQIGNDFESNDTFCNYSNNQIGNGFYANNLGDNTKWGWNDLSNISGRNFNLFSTSFQYFGGNFRDKIIFEELVMLDVANNQYYRVKFTRWTPLSDGFSYERTEIDPITGSDIGSTVYFTKTDGGSEVDVISSGVLEITSSPSNEGIYNQVSEGSYTGGFSPDGTLWNSRYTTYDSISGIYNYVSGNEFVNNRIANAFSDNTIKSFFGGKNGNTIGGDFSKNNIRQNFYDNSIGNSFTENVIKNYFFGNSIGNTFANNDIKNNFKLNEIQNSFQKNNIDYDFYSNEIQNNFESNLIGYDFHGNSIGSYFKNNIIGNYGGVRPASFYDNVIGNYFGTDINDNNLGNNIKTLFFGNRIGNFFNDNILFENFEANKIGNGFFQNLINDGFYSNTIGEDFKFNLLDSNFCNNNIGDEFTINFFGRNCFDNVIGNLCLLNVVGNRFESNIIGNIFAQNTISNNFTNNNLGDLNTDNIIGDDFVGNNTKLNFKLNQIQDNFEYNNVGSNFESNYILDNFLENDIDNDFKLNVIGTSSVYGNSANFEKNFIGHSFKSNRIGQRFKSNQIKDYFIKNEIGYAFEYNVIGSYFGNEETTPNFYFPTPFSNRIKDFFNNNRIDDYFGYDISGGGGNGGNLIGTKFNFNTIGHAFVFNVTYTDQYGGDSMSTNTIGDDFSFNIIKPHFNFNTIGNLFRNNDIDTDFTGNTIPYFFYSNTIGKYFISNVLSYTSMFNNIKDGFESNHIGDSFIGNFINIGCARNVIGDLMGSTTLGNTIGKDFTDNNIGNNFRLNTIANEFQYNKIGTFFEGNDIGVRFQHNEIGNYFGAKKNLFFSFYTPTGNTTKEDFIGNKIGNYFGNDFNYPAGSGGEDGGNLMASSFKNNTFGDNVIFNIFDKNFQWNQLGNEIWYNSFGKSSTSNKIGNLFVGNSGNGGWPNMMGPRFVLNSIGDITGFNQIRREFQHNKIGNRFGNSTLTGPSNDIRAGFQRNVIGNYFGSDRNFGNTRGGNFIESDFVDNQIGNEFMYNLISYSFSGNLIYNLFTNNSIGYSFTYNYISDGFDDNNIANSFTYNKIVTNKFFSNIIDNNFKQNIIETEISSVDFTTYNGEILTYTLTTSNSGITGTYSGLTPTGPSSLSGTGATFDVVISSGGTVSSVSINTSGKNYVTGNTFGIDGVNVGGVSGTDDVIITINNVRIPSVYATYSCHIIERYDGVKRLTYHNAFDALTVKNINI